MGSLYVKVKGGREVADVVGKGDVPINVPASDSTTNKNEFTFIKCDLFTYYSNE